MCNIYIKTYTCVYIYIPHICIDILHLWRCKFVLTPAQGLGLSDEVRGTRPPRGAVSAAGGRRGAQGL